MKKTTVDTPEGAGTHEGAGGYPAESGEAANSSPQNDSHQENFVAPADNIGEMLADVVESNDGFDPALHATNPDGTPKKKVDGSYALKRGRKSGALPVPGQPSAGALPTPKLAAQAQPTINADESARQACNILINGCVALFGEQWAPADKEEAKGLQLSFKNYFDARGVPNVPPEAGLVVAVLAYSLPRIGHEKTITRFQALKLRAWSIWQAMRGRK